MRHREKQGGEEKCNHRKGDGRSEPRIHHVFIELPVHGRSTGLQRTTQNYKGNDPTGIHCKSPYSFYGLPQHICITMAPPREKSRAAGIANTPTFRKLQKLTSSFSLRSAMSHKMVA